MLLGGVRRYRIAALLYRVAIYCKPKKSPGVGSERARVYLWNVKLPSFIRIQAGWLGMRGLGRLFRLIWPIQRFHSNRWPRRKPNAPDRGGLQSTNACRIACFRDSETRFHLQWTH